MICAQPCPDFGTNRENIEVAARLFWEETPPCCRIGHSINCLPQPNFAQNVLFLSASAAQDLTWCQVGRLSLRSGSEFSVKSCFWLHPSFSRQPPHQQRKTLLTRATSRAPPPSTTPHPSAARRLSADFQPDNVAKLNHPPPPVSSLDSSGLAVTEQRGGCHREFEIARSETAARQGRSASLISFRPQAEIGSTH